MQKSLSISCICLLASAISTALAQEIDWFGETIVSSAVHDRGEQIGPESLELGLGLEMPLGPGMAYLGGYRLTPLGDDQDLFDDEFDYSAGYVYEGEGFFIDASANWLTYPGEGGDASLELVGIIGWEAPFSPELVTFYDADFEDFGTEVVFTYEAALSEDWIGTASVLAGFVSPGSDDPDRSYGGLVLTAGRALSEHVEFVAFGRFDVADEDSFLKDHGNSAKDNNLAFGLSLSFAYGGQD